MPAKESRTLSWHLTVPDGCGVLSYKALATSGMLSDGEEGWLPVISRRVMLTESISLPIRDAGSKEFNFQKLLDSGTSTTLENRLVQVQVVSQPAWLAVLALPYHWQDGLGYYEVTRDSASHFFIDSLPAGTHVFETSVRVQHAGIYQTGVAEINCMYAPGFSAHR